MPIAWINTQGTPEPTYAHSYNQDSRTKVLTEAAEKLRTYNARVIDSEKFGKRIQDLHDELMPDVAREIPIDPRGLSREKVADWVFPYYVRADILALHYQRLFLLLRANDSTTSTCPTPNYLTCASTWTGRWRRTSANVRTNAIAS